MPEKNQKGNEQDFWNFISILLFLLIFSVVYYFFIKDKISIFYNVDFLDIFLISFATLRMIRLLSYDKVTSFMRNYFNKKEKGIGKTIYELLICPWCTGIWATLFLVPLYFLTDLGKIFILILAIAGIGSLIQVISNIIAMRREISIG